MLYDIITLEQIKDWLNITTVDKNDTLSSLVSAVTGYMEREIGQNIITRQYTEDVKEVYGYNIYLKNGPIWDDGSSFTLSEDAARTFAAASIVLAADYIIEKETGSILRLTAPILGDYTRRVVYWAGHSRFNLDSGTNNVLNVTDTGGSTTVTFTAGEYIASSLATEIKTILDADATLNGTYTVTYNKLDQEFTIACDEVFSLLFTESVTGKLFANLIGFHGKEDKTGGTSYEGDYAVTGIPKDLEIAALSIAQHWWSEARFGDNLQSIKSKKTGAVDYEYQKDRIPMTARETIDNYRKVSV